MYRLPLVRIFTWNKSPLFCSTLNAQLNVNIQIVGQPFRGSGLICKRRGGWRRRSRIRAVRKEVAEGEGEGRRKRRCRVFLNETSRQKTATPIMYSRRKWGEKGDRGTRGVPDRPAGPSVRPLLINARTHAYVHTCRSIPRSPGPNVPRDLSIDRHSEKVNRVSNGTDPQPRRFPRESPGLFASWTSREDA